MISKEKLREYTKLKNYNLGQAEKDYFQEIILFILYQEFGNELVFKGGTALTKCYGFDRFSEDLDFTSSVNKDFEKIISRGLKKYYLEFEFKIEKNDSSKKIVYNIQGPLYNGQKNSTCRIELDISLREKIIDKTNLKKIGLHLEEIPLFDVVVMSEEEILAEKIRTLMTRNKARDLYDAFYLLEKGTNVNLSLINQKLKFYSIKFSISEFKKAVNLKKVVWDSELKNLVKSYPSFQKAKKRVIGAFG